MGVGAGISEGHAMTPSKEQIEAWHDDATLGTKTLDLPHFACAAYAAGRKSGLEEAANVCNTEWYGDDTAAYSDACNECAEAIRALIEKEASK